MIPVLTRENHDYMHDTVPIVPLIGHHTLSNLRELWHPTRNTYEDIDSLCLAIDRASNPGRYVHSLERDLAGLAIEALMMQRTVLKEVGIYG